MTGIERIKDIAERIGTFETEIRVCTSLLGDLDAGNLTVEIGHTTLVGERARQVNRRIRDLIIEDLRKHREALEQINKKEAPPCSSK